MVLAEVWPSLIDAEVARKRAQLGIDETGERGRRRVGQRGRGRCGWWRRLGRRPAGAPVRVGPLAAVTAGIFLLRVYTAEELRQWRRQFAALMRVLCERNGGTFVGLNDY